MSALYGTIDGAGKTQATRRGRTKLVTHAAVLACADKFDKTTYSHFSTQHNALLSKPTLRRPLNADTLRAALLAECGEIVGEEA